MKNLKQHENNVFFVSFRSKRSENNLAHLLKKSEQKLSGFLRLNTQKENETVPFFVIQTWVSLLKIFPLNNLINFISFSFSLHLANLLQYT
jgi:hypothetical protein